MCPLMCVCLSPLPIPPPNSPSTFNPCIPCQKVSVLNQHLSPEHEPWARQCSRSWGLSMAVKSHNYVLSGFIKPLNKESGQNVHVWVGAGVPQSWFSSLHSLSLREPTCSTSSCWRPPGPHSQMQPGPHLKLILRTQHGKTTLIPSLSDQVSSFYFFHMTNDPSTLSQAGCKSPISYLLHILQPMY